MIPEIDRTILLHGTVNIVRTGRERVHARSGKPSRRPHPVASAAPLWL